MPVAGRRGKSPEWAGPHHGRISAGGIFVLIVRDITLLDEARQRIRDGRSPEVEAAETLKSDANEALQKGPFSVADKTQVPPSGDRRDYMSMGPYWWPDPDTPDGLPYVRRDGEVNPESGAFDRPTLSAMAASVEALALGWFFFGERAHADHAIGLLRAFFLDEAGRMNPNLEFGQAIPGHCEGRGIGIIETTVLATGLVDSIGLLRSSSRLTDEDIDGLCRWFRDYLDWLLRSPHGIDEGNQKNNHGTAYDLQVAVFSCFAGRERTARDVLAAVPERRLAGQIEADGSQPHELSRTKALGYATMNLGLFFSLADVGAKLGIDLWHLETADRRSIRSALDWLVPFWVGAEPWPFEQIIAFPAERAYELLRRAALAYEDSAYEEALAKLPLPKDDAARLRTNLYYPAGGPRKPACRPPV